MGYESVSREEAIHAINCLVEYELFDQIYNGQLKGEKAKKAFNEFVEKYSKVYFELTVNEIKEIAINKMKKMVADREGEDR